MTDTSTVVYTGNPALASALKTMMEREGLTVVMPPIDEQRGVGDVVLATVEMTVSGVAGTAIIATAQRAIAAFKARFPGGGQAHIDEHNDD